MDYPIWFIGFNIFLSVAFGNTVLNLNKQKWDVICNKKNISIKVKIPKTVHMALLENSYIQDPYYGKRDQEYAWIADEDWTYQTIFYVTKDMVDYPMIRLSFDGIDTVSKVLLNGFVVGKTDNMFVKYTFMVSKYIKLRNVLQVQFSSPTKYSEKQSKHYFDKFGYNVPPVKAPPDFHGRNHPNFIRKTQCSFGWGGGPSFPTIGIWKDVLVQFSQFVFLDEIMVHLHENVRKKTWVIHIKAIVRVHHPKELLVHYGVNGIKYKKRIISFTKKVPNKTFLGFMEIPKSDVGIWWPRGYGKQKLYEAFVDIIDLKSSNMIQKKVKFGFRTVELVQKPINGSDGLSFYFKINSVPIFFKGAVWVPVDSFQDKVTYRSIRRMLESCVEANVNVLRVLGGGIYEHDMFYKLANEMGIMIWQDFMFYVALSPANDEFVSNVKKEVLNQVHRLQHHPSIVIWVGNNENEVVMEQHWFPEILPNKAHLESDYKKLFIDTIKDIVGREDNTRPFIISSPSNSAFRKPGKVVEDNPQSPLAGDVHYYNYKGDCWDASIFPKPRFVAEYGYQSYPSEITMSQIAENKDLYWRSPLMKHRQHLANGDKNVEYLIKQHYNLPVTNNTQDYFYYMIYLSQIVQATCNKYETEHYRRFQGRLENGQGFTMGAIYNQLNDIWQGPSFGSIEYGGRWKMLHYFVKEFFQPVAVTGHVKGNDLNVFIVNDRPGKDIKLLLNVTVHNFDSFNILWSHSEVTSSQKRHSFQAYKENIVSMCASKKCFCKLKLLDASSDFILSQSDVFFSSLSAMTLKDPVLSISSIIAINKHDFEIKIYAKLPAVFVWLQTAHHGKFSKNGFNMVEPEIKVSFHSPTALSIKQLETTLKIISLYDTYKP